MDELLISLLFFFGVIVSPVVLVGALYKIAFRDSPFGNNIFGPISLEEGARQKRMREQSAIPKDRSTAVHYGAEVHRPINPKESSDLDE